MIHKYPELAYKEVRTARFIANELKKIGLSVTRNIARTGVVGLLKVHKEGKTVAIRADMDGLPIHEAGRKSYSSRYKGSMHACGHDAHIAMVIGSALLLSKIRHSINGNVKFIFQPSEENSPSGAQAMIKAGVLRNPSVSAVFGLHINTSLDSGLIGVKNGIASARLGTFNIDIMGKSSHVAKPGGSVDALLVASRVIKELHLVKRYLDPFIPCTIGIGIIQGGTASNIIADRVCMEGVLRIVHKSKEHGLMDVIKRIIYNTCAGYGADCNIKYHSGPPPIFNDKNLTKIVFNSACSILGRKNIKVIDRPSMGSDDFAFYAKKVPGTFFAVGIRNKQKGIISPGHTSNFDIDEDALPVGSAVMAEAVRQYLM